MIGLHAHRATTRNLCSLYLAQTGAGVPGDGPLLGRDLVSGRMFSFDPFELYPAVLTNPNVLVVGQVGAGKSTLAKLFCFRQATVCGRSVAILDPKGEYGALAHVLELARVELRPGKGTCLNPLDPGPTTASGEDLARRRAEVTGALAASGLGRPLHPEERAGIEQAVCELSDEPVLGDVAERLLEPTKQMASALHTGPQSLAGALREAALELRRLVKGDLAGMFNGRTTEDLRTPGPGVWVDLSASYRSPAALAPVMVAAGSWLSEAMAKHRSQHVLVLDETWQVLSDPGAARWLRQTMKLSRALGVSVLLVTHRIGDFDAIGSAGSEAARIAHSLVADTSARAVLAQPDTALSETVASLDLSRKEAELLPRLGRGRAIWHVGPHRALVQILVPSELESATDTDAEMRAR
jgi:type IV secretory pathway VirB4 component